MNLHVTKFMDLGNGEVHVDFGRGFLPSTRPSVFTFITKWEYLDQILIKKMVVPISPVPMSKCSLEVPISKCSLDNLPLPIKIGDKVLFQNRHTLLKYFNIGYHVLNMAFDNKYIIQNIYKTEDLFVITISDNYDLYKSHPLSHVDIFTLFGSDNTLGVIVNPIQQYSREVTPMQLTPYPFGPINAYPGFMGSGQIHKDNIKSRYNLDGMGYLKAMERKMDNEPKETTGKGERVKIDFADESSFFITDNTEDKKFDEPLKDEKIVPARIDEPNLFSKGDYVILKEKTIREGIAKGFIKEPFGSIFKDEKRFKILNISLDTLTAEYSFIFDDIETHFGFTIEADRVNEVITKVPLPNATFNILDKITEKVDMVAKQREVLEKTILAKYPLGSTLHISKKNFMTAVSDGYITGHFGLDLDSDTFLEIINVAVNPILKRVSFTLRKNNVNCGFTIDIDKVGVVTHKPIETKVNKPRTKKTETKK